MKKKNTRNTIVRMKSKSTLRGILENVSIIEYHFKIRVGGRGFQPSCIRAWYEDTFQNLIPQ